jgi:hypothetical protein
MGDLEDLITSGPAIDAASHAFSMGMMKLIQEYRTTDQETRLLLLLGDALRDFHGTRRRQFKHWKKTPELEELLRRCIYRDSGDLTPPTEFNGVIERQLKADGFPELAERPQEIVDALWQLGPLAIESVSESTAAILSQIETSQQETREKFQSLEALMDRGSGRSLGEALIRGPVEYANADRLVSEAAEIVDSNPEGAVSILLDASGRLREHGLYVVAESVGQRAAEILLERVPERSSEALNLLIHVARDQLNRGSGLAQASFRSIESASVKKPEWLGGWMDGMRYWQVVPDHAKRDLLTAIRSEGTPPWVMADAAEVLLLLDGVEEGRHHLMRVADESDDGIRIKLCLADADHGDWDELVDLASKSRHEMAALIHARHGRYLAHHDKSAESVEAFEKSMSKWSHVPNADEQIASAFYSVQVVARTSQDLADRLNFDLWPLAYELRSPADFPESRGSALESQGMSNRLAGRYRESLIAYASALLVFRKSGSLNSESTVQERLGELNESAGEFNDAIRQFINAGKGEAAKKIARKCDLKKLEHDMDLTGPGWQRVAIYSVLGEIGEVVSPSYVARNLDQIISDIENPIPEMPTLKTMGSVALSTVSILVPEEHRDQVRALVADQITDHLGYNERAAARALELGTEMGIWDESDLLLDVYLEEPSAAVDAGWIAEVANRNERVALKLKQAAMAGSYRALSALSFADIKLDTPRHLIPAEMVALCDEQVRSRLGQSSVETGRGSVKISEIRIDDIGAIALRASPGIQDELVDDTLRIATGTDETENFRASAMSILDDLVPTLDDEKAVEVAEVVSKLAAGDYARHAADRNQNHPFSAVRISLHIEGYLRACAIQCAGALEKKTPELVPNLKGLVLAGLSDSRFTVIRGALIASEYVPYPEYLGLLRYLSRHEAALIRTGAFRAINAAGIEVESCARALVKDPAPLVRYEVLNAMRERNDPWAMEILRELEGDPDAYLRWTASQAARS